MPKTTTRKTSRKTSSKTSIKNKSCHKDVYRFILLVKNAAPCAMEHIFNQGGCYRFHLILKSRFPDAVAYWNKERNHVLTKIDGYFFDICGYIEDEEKEVGCRMDRSGHGTAALFAFDEVKYVAKTVRGYMNGEGL